MQITKLFQRSQPGNPNGACHVMTSQGEAAFQSNIHEPGMKHSVAQTIKVLFVASVLAAGSAKAQAPS